ncbi:SDR family NAD(P)-dependent oxidoreductase [Amycolatopsis sp. NPDC026612]|uniref:SDR family NAD(P)-dependent oxidoreductase n=1 Tax=Amycolatopsis sp. NPDC026612 TaxID=3155466 RepID=UPI0033ED2939
MRDGRVLVPRLQRVAPAESRAEEHGTVLITGGTGLLGSLVARRLVTEHGVRSLVLASRQGVDQADELRALGAEVRVVACDIGDRDEVRTLLDGMPGLTGVVHAAGVLDDGVLTALDESRLDSVFRAKVDGAVHLDELTRDLTMFVLFSSAAGVLGHAGQANYAAANGFLDGLAARRRARGEPAVSLAWGLWADESGLTDGIDRAYAGRDGVGALTTGQGLELFDRALAANRPLLVPVRLDLPALRRRSTVPPLLRGLVRPVRREARAAGFARREDVENLVRTEASAVLGGAEIAPARAFRDAGFDSLTAVDLRNRLATATGLTLPATLVFDHPDPAALAAHLHGVLTGHAPATTAEATAPVAEPIAVVGMGLRLPGGVDTPEALWELVRDGVDAIGGFPEDRGWDLTALYDPDPAATGHSYTRSGGFLPDAGVFDAGFFGISPREALAMDPQQRLLLQTSWEALERAGIAPTSLRGQRVGVFTGLMYHDYGTGAPADPELEGLRGTGSAGSVAAGRVSYVLGVQGPAVVVDTACSSSLVALHLAAQALRAGECSMALAGGATVLSTPEVFVEFSRQRGLSADGRCKSFSDEADGTGWAEGAGVVVLQRLSDAVRDGREVLAVIRGSAVNSDGASNGLTAPNGPAQQAVIRQALAAAGLEPSEVDAVEAHGTGTVLGDPIEAQALLATYGAGRETPLWLGSLKSNIGHAQAAAGVSGVLKMIMAMRHGVLPRTLHAESPSSRVDWSAGAVELLAENRPWDTGNRPRRAAVSSFGVSGTNAHLVLEQGPPPAPVEPVPVTTPVPLVVTARTPEALRAQAARLAGALGDDLAGTAVALVGTRAVWEHRAVVTAVDREAALAGLTALADGVSAPDVLTGAVTGTGTAGRLTWVFPGQGAQWAGMGRELWASNPVFAARMTECEAALAPHVGWSLSEVVREAQPLAAVDVVQPVSFAVMVSLAAVWESLGLRPDAVLGHSQGEIAAACVAGALSLQDAARIVAVRSRIIAHRLAGHGGMLSVALDEAALRLPDGVELAAVNSPSSVVLAGDPAALDALEASYRAQDVRVRRIPVDYASHTAHVERAEAELLAALSDVDSRAPETPWFSTVGGEWISAAVQPDYWYRNLREPVRFADAVTTLAGAGHRVFLEVSSHPVVTAAIQETVADALVCGTLRRDEPESDRLLRAAADLFTRGVALDWTPFLPEAVPVALPTTAFLGEHYWLRPAPGGGQDTLGHPVLGAAVEDAASGGIVFIGRLSRETQPWLSAHAVTGTVLLPGAALVELAVRAGDHAGTPVVRELVVETPLVLPETGTVPIQVVLGAPDDDERAVSIHSHDDGGWVRHAAGVLTPSTAASTVDFSPWPPPGAVETDLSGFYADLADRGYEYGPQFQGVTRAWRRDDDVFAEVELPGDADPRGFGIHPALLDAALHPLIPVAGEEVELPFAWTGVTLHATGATAARVRIRPAGTGTAVELADGTGAPLLSVAGLVTRPVDRLPARERDGAALFAVDWIELPPGEATGLDAEVLAVEGIPLADVLRRIQEFVAGPGTRLVVRTRDAVATPHPDPAAAAVWGLVRSAQAEHPDRLVLVDGDLPDGRLTALGEDQCAVRDGRVLVPRLVRSTRDGLDLPDGPWVLRTGRTFDDLALEPSPTEALRPGQVRVAVRAAGINFRDVLAGLGVALDLKSVAGEGAGVVVEVGPDVAGFAVGDRVLGLVTRAFEQLAVADVRTLVPMPAGWSFETAASVPIVFTTAYYGLADLAGLRPGERVLIHAAAGGVGLAAVQLARHFGAEVFATASPGKQHLLRELGIDDDHLANSRTLGFAAKFGPVDVVLNSLTGEFADASLGLLAEGGRFLELGKTDLRTGLDGYRAYDLHDAGPERIGELLREVLALFGTGVLEPLPVTAWDVRHAPAAFRFMAQGRHTGKNVLTTPRRLDPAGTVLVTGGTGRLGALVARHLVTRHGVRDLLLASRRGPAADGAADLVAELTAAGAQVRVVACDVADRDRVRDLLDGVPLTAVVHAAGALADGVLAAQDAERLATAFRPKADAAVVLDELTRAHDLAAFVLFSSAAGVLGGAGQAGYSAANAFLDGLAARRRAEGLPAVSLAWGRWADESALTAHLGAADTSRMARAGVGALTAEQGLRLFDEALAGPRITAVPMVFDPAALRERARTETVPPLLRELAGRGRRTARTAARAGTWTARLSRLDDQARVAALTELVTAEAAVVLGGGAAVAGGRAFRDAGFDSLTAVELRNRLTAATGVSLPATAVFDHPTPAALAAHLRDALLGTVAAPAPVAAAAAGEPIAIVGAGVRLPGGVDSPEALWRLLSAGVDAITPFPADRGWTGVAGAGGFLADAGQFDAAFFGISPREALAMDPQQRVVLRTAWEALERAGIAPTSVRGTDVGVFLGAMAQDYGTRVHEAPAETAGFALTGSSSSVLSGRVSYVLGATGPAVTVDTACSSSLVAIHLAAQSLRSGECSTALAGGVTVMATPAAFVEFARQGGLSADGRCRAFADDADGTGWAEGAGVLVLQRLSDAVREGREVLAVVRGTAVNQDGASNGLTAPHGPAQQAVLRRALATAGLRPSEVDVVEAHGTGTVLGDPIEVQAVQAVYGTDRETPLWLGSLKSNIGHAQAAAGVAGVVKMVLAMRHGVLPCTLHAGTPSSRVDWTAGAVRLLSEPQDWPAGEHPRRAGVSSFGVSGTNAHLVLEEAPPAADREPAPDTVVPLVVSARSAGALAEQAGRLASALAEGAPLPEVGWSLVRTRAVWEHRAVVTTGDRDEAVEALRAVRSAGPAEANGTAFVFAGQGAQRPGMGMELYAQFPAYAEAFDEVCAELDRHLDRPLADVITSDAVHETAYAQAGLFAVEVAMSRLLASFGVRPGVVAGHSLGELSAAHVAGVLTLPDAARLVAARGRLMQALVPGGAMLAVTAAEADVEPLLGEGVWLAAVNGPASVVLSGTEAALAAAAGELAARGVETSALPVRHAFHSDLVEPVLAEFAAEAARVDFHEPVLPLVSTVTGELAGPEVTTPEYWVTQIRRPVRFADAAGTLLSGAPGTVVELGPGGVLTALLRARADSTAAVALTRRDRPERVTLLAALATLFTRGADVDWTPFFPAATRHLVPLPTTVFREQHFWLHPEPAAGDAAFWAAVAREELPAGAPDSLAAALPDLARWHRGRQAETAVADWRHQVTWERLPEPAARPGRWRVLDDDGTFAALHTAEDAADHVLIVSDGRVEHLLSRLRDLLADPAAGRIWVVTRGAVSVDGEPADPRAAQVWGLGRTAALEHPGRWGGLVDVTADADDTAVGRAIAVLGGEEDQVAVRTQGAFGRRLIRRNSTVDDSAWTPRGTVLVTGGTGGLGAHLARWLVDRGADRVVLVSRRGAPAVEHERITAVAADVTDRAALAAVLAGYPPDAVVHAAGVSGGAVAVQDLDPATLERVLGAKADGALLLDELLGDRPLDAFVLFSSVAATWGAAGQGAYAAANCTLDALAVNRRARGRTAVSIAWGPWDGEGMGAEDGARARFARGAVATMRPEHALTALDLVLRDGEPAAVVAPVDWRRFVPVFTAGRPSPLLRAFAEPATEHRPRTTTTDLAELTELVRSEARTVLRGAEVAPRQAFRDAGFDSLTAIELRDALTARTGLALPATTVFDHPDPIALATHLRAGLTGGTTAEPVIAAAADGDDPIVVVGIGLRLPGDVDSPEALWDLVSGGVDAISAFPADRGWTGTGAGGFVHDAALFDAGFFGISPREAMAMDPQQRLVLRTAWEALERAGIAPTALRDEPVGVFVGASAQPYGTGSDPDGFGLTGASSSVLSGRLSYVLGLRGPAVTVDTACSSSLVAIHLAAQSLRTGECGLALAGGVTVMTTPAAYTEFARQGGLAGDGRCKSFSDDADGTSWAEGAGVLVLQRLSAARRDGREVLAVVRGTAVNSDGASNGLTAPSGPAQQGVIRQALANAGLTPSEVDVVEAHGTGTALGDPIEAQAVLATYGAGRDTPLRLGSLKSNIGHTQAAAGVAGVVKMIMAMRHGELPRTLHVSTPSSRVDWTAGNVRLLTEPEPWPAGEHPRRAGVSSFGVSGTNAHLVLEEPPAAGIAEPVPDPGVLPVVVSARSAAGLVAQVDRVANFLAGQETLAAPAWSLLRSRALGDHRAVVLAGSPGQAAESLRLSPIRGEADPARAGVAFVFTGQGAQRPEMGFTLAAEFPVFAAAFDEVCAELDRHLDRPLRSAIGSELVHETAYTQAALFAFEVAAVRLLASFGVRPRVVAGHSLGELTAAYVAGVFSLEDAAMLVAHRGRLMGALSPGGAMVAVEASEADVEPLLGEGVWLAAVNGPRSVVLSGEADAVQRAAASLPGRTTALPARHAFHSGLVEPMLAEFAQVTAKVTYREPELPVLAGEVTRGEYWVDQVRRPVRFADALTAITAHDVAAVLEVGPDAVLAAMVPDPVPAFAITRRDRPEPATFLASLAELFARGADVGWSPRFPAGLPIVPVPTTAFQERRYWLKPPAPETPSSRYRVEWEQVPAAGAQIAGRRWLVAAAGDDLGVAAALRARGAEVVPLTWEDGREATTRCIDGAGPLDGLVLVTGAADAATALPAVQAALTAAAPTPVWVVTRGVAEPAVAQVWALGRTAALEHPTRWGGLAGLDGPDAADLLPAVLTGAEDQVSLRANGVFARRLVPDDTAAPGEGWIPRGTVLVTGGGGTLAPHLTRWLADAGAGHVVLLGRGAPVVPGRPGCRVTAVACDVTDRAALARVLEQHPPDAVVHAVGASGGPAGVTELTPADLTDARVTGAVHLDELLGDRPLDAFVLFSATAGVWGAARRGAFAAGAGFLDAFAEHRRSRGRTALSVAWGTWATGALTAEARQHLDRQALSTMDPDTALSALRAASATGRPSAVVTAMDWPRFGALFTAARPSPLLAGLFGAETEPEDPGAADALRNRLRPLDGEGRRTALTELVRAEATAVLGTDPGPARPFRDAGFDSLTAVELRRRLAAATGTALPATVVFDHPTAQALAEHLAGVLTIPASTLDELLDSLDPAALDERTAAKLRRFLDASAAPKQVNDDLDAVTADGLFDFLDRELGRP